MSTWFKRFLQLFKPQSGVRDIKLTVGATPIGSGITWAYPAGSPTAHYRIPTYKLTAEGTNATGTSVKADFEVFRFGVKQDVGGQARVVGLADLQTHVIKMWLPAYKVHSAASNEIGAWQVYDDFLIHDGPDDPNSTTSPFATVGCIELCGSRKFDGFNDFLIALSGLTAGTREAKLNTMGTSGKLAITYLKADRPPLVRI